MPITLHVISHTHWDREWYLPFEAFRLRLVDLIDHLLDILDRDPAFLHFNLDAQTIVLEDYLEVRPGRRAELERRIREGRIAVGPWYQLNDEFLVSGESTVRSLLIGHRMAEAFGACMKIGYLPDQFGNLGQMPQILRGFGIDNAIMGRGRQLVGDRKAEFWWEAPDGSRVLGVLMAWWYNNAQYIPDEAKPAVEALQRLRDTMAPRCAFPHLLLMNGVDHLEAQPAIGRVVREANAIMQRTGSPDRVVHSSLDAYIGSVREAAASVGDLEVVRGELREDRGGACLAGTLSTRMYLKQANHRAQQALESVAERLAAFARVDGAVYPFEQLRYAWRLLMRNHAHDSICGCSTDQVHREMMPRFDGVQQIAGELTDRALDTLTARDRRRGARPEWTELRVYNTLNWSRTDPVRAVLECPLGEPSRGRPERDDARAPSGFRLLSAAGEETPFAVTGVETLVRQVLNPRELPLDQWVRRVSIEFVARDVPACGFAAYQIEPLPSMPQYDPYHKGEVAWPPVSLEDCGEVGDEYLHRKPLVDRVYRASALPSPLSPHVEANAVRETWASAMRWALPVSATPDGQARSEELVECATTVRATRWAGVPRLEIEVEFDNRASDHRLRLLAWGYRRPLSHAVAEGQFDAVERPIEHPQEREGALPFHPQQSWVSLGFEGEPASAPDDEPCPPETITVINEGLPEYEIYSRERDLQFPALAVTLLRCVAQLSGRGDGPGTPTPEAQCHGKHRFRLSLLHTEGGWRDALVWRQAHQFNVPLIAVQCPPGEGAASRSYLAVEPDTLVVTAVKRAEDRDTIVVRLFNIAPDVATGACVRLPGARRRRIVTLNEEPTEEWAAGDSCALDVAPKQIITVEFDVDNA
ncbi:MAG TPA: glycosyl hydrolase-related protein [Chthonomonadales bacterium]|nr:glycosyl hydrolase-related protein [Chthonomonadales bacterium]